MKIINIELFEKLNFISLVEQYLARIFKTRKSITFYLFISSMKLTIIVHSNVPLGPSVRIVGGAGVPAGRFPSQIELQSVRLELLHF